MRWFSAALLLVAACAHGRTATDAPPEELVSWANEFPFAAHELCLWENRSPEDALRVQQWVRDYPIQATDALQTAATQPRFWTRRDSGWKAHVPLPGDPAIEALLDWASRHPDAAMRLEPQALEWTAAHRNCQN
jgi:hypothetical protein